MFLNNLLCNTEEKPQRTTLSVILSAILKCETKNCHFSQKCITVSSRLVSRTNASIICEQESKTETKRERKCRVKNTIFLVEKGNAFVRALLLVENCECRIYSTIQSEVFQSFSEVKCAVEENNRKLSAWRLERKRVKRRVLGVEKSVTLHRRLGG